MRSIKDYTEALRVAGITVIKEAAGSEEIASVTYNSKAVVPGTLFICKGAHFKEQYLAEAVSKGAVCYISEKEYAVDCDSIIVDDIRAAMPVVAETFYGRLSEQLKMIGITGTKGKSTTTYFVRQILDDWMEAAGGKRSAVCSGINNYDGVIDEESHLTTPEIMELYWHMRNALDSGISHLTMEVSSQALKYGRVEGINYEVACFLNIGTDHISAIEHPDYEDYFHSKLLIFRQCKKACINLDCDGQDEMLEAAKNSPEIITFSQKNADANVYAYDIVSNEGRVSFRAKIKDINGYEDMDEELKLATFGTINIENAIAALAIAAACGVPFEYIRSGLAKAVAPGRMEVFRSADDKKIVLVDYAHNKLSYKALFESIAGEFPSRKLVIIFGTPGGKAFARREELGSLAGEYCVKSYITEEDCGEEDCRSICEEIATHVASAGGEYEIILDRVEAIRKAIAEADENVIVIAAGKGRETRQKRGIEYIDTPSDVEVAVAALAE